jgi:DNA topoisomerase-3
MVAKQVAMAHELAKTLSDNNYKSKRYYQDGSLRQSNDHDIDDRSLFIPVFEFTTRFCCSDARVWLISTMGGLYTKDFEIQLKEPSQAFNLPIVQRPESNNDFKKNLPFLLEDVAKGSDALVLLFDNDLDGEDLAYQVIDTVKHVMKKPPCGMIMDVIYRARFFSVPEIKASMQRLEKPDIYKYLAIDAKQKLELILGKSFAGHQKKVLRWRFPNLLIRELPFNLGSSIALAKIVEQFKVKEKTAAKFTLELKIEINNRTITALLDSKTFNNRQSAEEVCQRLKEAKYCEVVLDPVSVPQSVGPLAGLDTFELLQFMSKHFGLSLLEIDQISQKLYSKAFITNPRTNSTKYQENIGDCVNYFLRTFPRRVSPNYGIPEVSVDMPLNVDDALKIGINDENHPSIIPTEKFPSSMLMAPNEGLVYSFICCRFLASFMPKYTYFKETTIFGIEDCKFEYSCFKAGEDGFTKVLPKLKVKTVEEDEETLSNFILGNKFLCDIQVKEIPSPKLLHESELLERIGSAEGICKHLLILQKAGYIEINEHSREIYPTQLGINLAESYQSVIPEMIEPKFREKFVDEINDVATGYKDFVEVYDKHIKETWGNFKKFAANFDQTKIDFDKFETCFEKQNLGFYAN